MEIIGMVIFAIFFAIFVYMNSALIVEFSDSKNKTAIVKSLFVWKKVILAETAVLIPALIGMILMLKYHQY